MMFPHNLWFLISPRSWKNFPSYINDLIKYKKESKEKIPLEDLYPQLNDKKQGLSIDKHYFYQDLWAILDLSKRAPSFHVDIASRIDTAAHMSAVCEKVDFVEIKPENLNHGGFRVVNADMINLPYEDGSVESISSLHSAEHVGLGRYGDKLDVLGTEKACREIVRVLRPGGTLLFSLPVGFERVCFNAHRVHNPSTIIAYFFPLVLEEFSVVDEKNNLFLNVDPLEYEQNNYCCGLFKFKVPVIEEKRGKRKMMKNEFNLKDNTPDGDCQFEHCVQQGVKSVSGIICCHAHAKYVTGLKGADSIDDKYNFYKQGVGLE